MTNSESVYDNRLMACKIFAERNATYRWIDGMKLIVLTTIPDILPFLTTKPGHTRCQFARGSLILVMSKERADLAATSAISLPRMLTWLGIHFSLTSMKDTRVHNYYCIYIIRNISS